MSTVSHSPGTTSAYAENTNPILKSLAPSRNYLRVRGEYVMIAGFFPEGLELPPRTRRILITILKINLRIGTTSAYAENTLNELGLL